MRANFPKHTRNEEPCYILSWKRAVFRFKIRREQQITGTNFARSAQPGPFFRIEWKRSPSWAKSIDLSIFLTNSTKTFQMQSKFLTNILVMIQFVGQKYLKVPVPTCSSRFLAKNIKKIQIITYQLYDKMYVYNVFAKFWKRFTSLVIGKNMGKIQIFD